MELCSGLERYECDAPLTEQVEGLLGDHPRIDRGGCPYGWTKSWTVPRGSAPTRCPASARTSACAPPWSRRSAPGCGWTTTGRG
ncbi:hypothetical protein NKH18_25195 [Streptomyces sp. M10(2022)]